MARVNLRDRTGLGNTERTSRVTGDRRRLPGRPYGVLFVGIEIVRIAGKEREEFRVDE